MLPSTGSSSTIWPNASLRFLNFLPLTVITMFFTGTGSCENQEIEVIKESGSTQKWTSGTQLNTEVDYWYTIIDKRGR